ncbi:MAG: hypothetical protein IJL84_01465 [Paludibacteraceae bacterium]|nr:hypothetical protein [Paludibacteraceae bacterium]
MSYVDIGNDLKDFFKYNTKVFLNERDLQIELILFLRVKGYVVHPEYHIPVSAIPGYEWGNDKVLSIDLVVEDSQCGYVPIELKYKHKELKLSLDRFGEEISGLITSQAAQNIGRYSFWKDVRRVEHLIGRFNEKIKDEDGGYVVFVTDDPTYMKNNGVGCNYQMFAMNDGRSVGPSKLDWVTPNPKFPGFNIVKHYDIKWEAPVKLSCITYYGLIQEVI